MVSKRKLGNVIHNALNSPAGHFYPDDLQKASPFPRFTSAYLGYPILLHTVGRASVFHDSVFYASVCHAALRDETLYGTILCHVILGRASICRAALSLTTPCPMSVSCVPLLNFVYYVCCPLWNTEKAVDTYWGTNISFGHDGQFINQPKGG